MAHDPFNVEPYNVSTTCMARNLEEKKTKKKPHNLLFIVLAEHRDGSVGCGFNTHRII